MSDDDLWPREDAPADEEASGEASAQQPPASQSVGDETRPLHDAPTSPAGPGAVPPPQNPFGQPSPYGAPPPQDPYAQNPYGQNPFGQSPAGQSYPPPPNPYSAPHEYATPQSPYGAPYQPAYAGGALPDHPSATTAMVLGIVGLVGILLCGGITLVLSPAAWVVGRKAVREIDASAGRLGGRDRAQAGKIMGIIGTVLLVVGILVFVAAAALLVTTSHNPQPVGQQHGFLNG